MRFITNKKPDWWPACPYPEEVFPMTVKDYIEAVPDPKMRTAISGFLARFGWQMASQQIWDRMEQVREDNDHA